MRNFDIEVCLDCHLAHHTGDSVTGTEWALIGPDESVTDNSTCRLCFESDHECDHNHDHFSSRTCEGCGSSLAGERYVYALWTD